jgi:hypothetical protein
LGVVFGKIFKIKELKLLFETLFWEKPVVYNVIFTLTNNLKSPEE